MTLTLIFKAIDQADAAMRKAHDAGSKFSRVEFLEDAAFRIENREWVRYIYAPK